MALSLPLQKGFPAPTDVAGLFGAVVLDRATLDRATLDRMTLDRIVIGSAIRPHWTNDRNVTMPMQNDT